jgi:hypothetical protein
MEQLYRWTDHDERGGAGADRGDIRNTRAGIPVSNSNGSQGENFEERARRHNSRLQLLIEGIGGLLAASADLLGRLQRILGGGGPADGGREKPGGPDEPTPTDCQG